MSNEKYLNYYIEILSNSISEAILKNISLQANARISDDIIGQLSKTIEEQNTSIDKLKSEYQSELNNLKSGHQSDFDNSQRIIDELRKQIQSLSQLKFEYENNKHQVQHLNTFKNELERAREENKNLVNSYEEKIKELNEKIEYLQLPPAKRKKIDEAKLHQINTSKSEDDF